MYVCFPGTACRTGPLGFYKTIHGSSTFRCRSELCPLVVCGRLLGVKSSFIYKRTVAVKMNAVFAIFLLPVITNCFGDMYTADKNRKIPDFSQEVQPYRMLKVNLLWEKAKKVRQSQTGIFCSIIIISYKFITLELPVYIVTGVATPEYAYKLFCLVDTKNNVITTILLFLFLILVLLLVLLLGLYDLIYILNIYIFYIVIVVLDLTKTLNKVNHSQSPAS